MLPRPIRHRRARRTDFDAIAAILAASGLPAPAPERAGLRRFRRLVADLGTDLYVAETDARVLGIVHVTYVRPVSGAPRARLELLGGRCGRARSGHRPWPGGTGRRAGTAARLYRALLQRGGRSGRPTRLPRSHRLASRRGSARL